MKKLQEKIEAKIKEIEEQDKNVTDLKEHIHLGYELMFLRDTFNVVSTRTIQETDELIKLKKQAMKEVLQFIINNLDDVQAAPASAVTTTTSTS